VKHRVNQLCRNAEMQRERLVALANSSAKQDKKLDELEERMMLLSAKIEAMLD